MDIEVLRQEFDRREHAYEQLMEEALFILKPAIKDAGIKIHSINHRVKTVDSFLNKVRSKTIENPFEDIRDIVGLRVICLFQSDIERVGRIVRESFAVFEEDNKVEGADLSSFGYMSVHFVVTMKETHSGPRYDPIAKLQFEIQVRTIAMDAWANVSHYLDYKTDQDIPSDLKRDFYALSGLFYVADRHFEMFFLSRQESREKLIEIFQESPLANVSGQEINLDSIRAYLQRKFPDRKHAEANDISELVSQLVGAGYTSVDDVERGINKGWDVFVKYERENKSTVYPYYWDIGATRITLALIDEKFREAGVFLNPLHKTFYEQLGQVAERYRDSFTK